MSDSSKVFSGIKKSLKKLFPEMSGHKASHFGTLLHIITGMVMSKHCHLPKIASKIQSNIKQESLVQKIERWLQNDKVNGTLYFLPFLKMLLPTLLTEDVSLLIDGSVVGRDSACLMISLAYKNRSIPIAWVMGEGRKGHFKEEAHLALLDIVQSILPDELNVTIIGDGEFDGVNFLENIQSHGWNFVVRAPKTGKFTKGGIKVNVPKRLKAGNTKMNSEIDFTNEFYGPLSLVSTRLDNKNGIIHLLSSHKIEKDIIRYYKLRQRIETLFSDFKTKGFHLQKSHISDLARLSNLIMAACLGYIWVVLLGEYAVNKGYNKEFHRTERCDLSFLQLGFRFIDFLINISKSIPQIIFKGAI